MYVRICSGVMPFCSSSRTSWRRSTARSACESAIVWFWQTRQRSSCVMASMRDSSAGSEAVGRAVGAWNAAVAPVEAASDAATAADGADAGASAAIAGRAAPTASSPAIRRRRTSAIELPQQRKHLVAQHLGRQRADLLEADDALLV